MLISSHFSSASFALRLSMLPPLRYFRFLPSRRFSCLPLIFADFDTMMILRMYRFDAAFSFAAADDDAALFYFIFLRFPSDLSLRLCFSFFRL